MEDEVARSHHLHWSRAPQLPGALLLYSASSTGAAISPPSIQFLGFGLLSLVIPTLHTRNLPGAMHLLNDKHVLLLVL